MPGSESLNGKQQKFPPFTVERTLHPLAVMLRTRKRGYLVLFGAEIGKSTWGKWYAFLQVKDKTIWLRRSM
jgi:hypothetical protein